MRSLNLVGRTCSLSEAHRKLLFPSPAAVSTTHTATQLPGEVCLQEAALFPPENSGKGLYRSLLPGLLTGWGTELMLVDSLLVWLL